MGSIACPATIDITTPTTVPYWALLERELLRAQAVACEHFFDHYFDERGYLLCYPRWGGDDGPDDAAENLLNWPILHALGAPDAIRDLYRKGWEGHLRQYTEAKTVDVPMARDGMYYKEFPVMFDWFHHGESYAVIVLQGLSDPDDRKLRERMQRYSGFYMGEDPQAPNWDPEHKIIRSMMNGSRGPMLRKATGLDWAGDPFEIEGRFRLGHGEHTYQQVVEHFQDYNDVVGDHPLNLGATSMAFCAYALTGMEKYRDWALEYIDAWAERSAANGGLIPTNIGLDGTIGGEVGGKWYGGVYGWGFSVFDPATGEVAHRPGFQSRCAYGFGNGLLLSWDVRYVDVWRTVIHKVRENAQEIDGQLQYPYSYGDEGWYNWQPQPFAHGTMEIYYWSMDPEDRNLIPPHEASASPWDEQPSYPNHWLDFLEGSRPDYPAEALAFDLERVRRKMEMMRADTSTPDTRLSDDMNHMNPATTDALIQLMLGGLPTGRTGYPLHCRVRYFDPERRRAGLPEDVAALVERMTADETTLQLVNINQTEARTLIVQGGAYGEHQIESVTLDDQTMAVDARTFAVTLAPGAGACLSLRMKRYANLPSLAFPWI
jgi:hypothetical protein